MDVGHRMKRMLFERWLGKGNAWVIKHGFRRGSKCLNAGSMGLIKILIIGLKV